mgnify:CR=1 FL=1
MIKFISKGLYTTIQDYGRFGYRNIGVPSSGYMDRESAQIANLILGNPINNPLIEATLIGPTIKFEKSTFICITGSDFNPMLNESKISLYTPVEVSKGDILKINNPSIGSRCYISIKGDIELDKVLGSKSYYSQISNSSVIEKGDEFKFEANDRNLTYKSIDQKFKLNNNIKVFRGPEFNCLDKESINKLKNEELVRKSIQDFKTSEKIPLILILDNVRSLNNIGSIFRISDAFLIEKIILCGITACPPHKDIHKTALGATESVQWQYCKNTSGAVDQLKTKGVVVLAIEQAEGSTSLSDFTPQPNTTYALVFGHEVKGVSQEIVSAANEVVEIPQEGTKHSLNVSVSVGLVVWELFSSLSKQS